MCFPLVHFQQALLSKYNIRWRQIWHCFSSGRVLPFVFAALCWIYAEVLRGDLPELCGCGCRICLHFILWNRSSVLSHEESGGNKKRKKKNRRVHESFCLCAERCCDAADGSNCEAQVQGLNLKPKELRCYEQEKRKRDTALEILDNYKTEIYIFDRNRKFGKPGSFLDASVPSSAKK